MSDAPPPEFGLPDTGRTMRMPRRRGAVSGVLLVLLGAWAALAPFVGPYFHFAYTPHPRQSWHWTAARGWYEVLPGGLAVFAGLVLLVSTHRVVTVLAGWLAAIAGGWLVVGPTASIVLRLGSIGRPDAATDRRYVAEMLAFFAGAGALIILVAAIAIGRLSARTVGDLRAAAVRDEAGAGDESFRGYDQDATDRLPVQPEPYAGAGLATAAAQHGHDEDDAQDGYDGQESYEARDHADPHALADETAELPVAEPATEDEPEPEPAPEPPVLEPQQEHEPLVLEPPAGFGPASAPTSDAPPETPPAPPETPQPHNGDPGQVWNPEDQQPTTTGELPRVDEHRMPDQPRRYYRPPTTPGSEAVSEPIRQDEEIGHDLDFDDAPSQGR